MTPERLAEIRELADNTAYDTLPIVRSALLELLAENATLKGEVERLKQCEVNMHFLLGCIEEAHGALPDYPLGKWQERAKALAPAIATLRSRLDALVTAAEKATQYALKEWGSQAYNPYTNKLETTSYNYVVDGRAIDALSTAVEQAKREGKE